MITGAIPAYRLFDHKFGKIRSNLLILTEELTAKIKQSTITSFQPQTQTTSVILSPNMNYTEISESISPTKVTGT